MNSILNIRKYLGIADTNLKGRKIFEKIIIIESDDWGSIRMPNKKVFDNLKNFGIPVDKSAYCVYDGLERSSDIRILLETFDYIEKKYGKKVKFTLNYVTANPDFHKIKAVNKCQYFFESIKDTYIKYDNNTEVLNLVKHGVDLEYFSPQFHGRDHVNVPLWLELLKDNKMFQRAFELGMWGLSKDVFPYMKKSIQATYDSIDKNYIENSLSDGIKLFNEIFSMKPQSFISNNYIWNNDVYSVLNDIGINVLQGMKYQLLPLNDNESERRKIRHYFGEKNRFNMIYNIRNCSFEPSEKVDSVGSVLRQINLAFMFNKPAVISSHRINYTSRLNEKKRDSNIEMLKNILEAIIIKWPNVKFLSSNQLTMLDYEN